MKIYTIKISWKYDKNWVIIVVILEKSTRHLRNIGETYKKFTTILKNYEILNQKRKLLYNYDF